MESSEIKHFYDLDQKIVQASRPIKILTNIAWPKKIQKRFLARWKKGGGGKIFPSVEYPRPNLTASLQILDQILNTLHPSHPIEFYIYETAKSYRTAALMLNNLMKPQFTAYSMELYGKPDDLLPGSNLSSLQAARYFVEAAYQFENDYNFSPEENSISAEEIKSYLEKEIPSIIRDDKVAVHIDEALPSKAAAGAKAVRLRSGNCFSQYDFLQLLHHEVFTHTLTALNGRNQLCLKSMGLGAPRTTAIQEGLATFSELITGAIDIGRFKRIALRILAIDMALKGGDFFDVFKFFLNAGQNEEESFNSTMRIFRGGDPGNKGIVFTKDTVYLYGLLSVHAFFRWSLKNKILDAGRFLFAGRMVLSDVAKLRPFIKEGIISPPKYVPSWFERFQSLVGNLVFSLFASKIRLENFEKSLDEVPIL